MTWELAGEKFNSHLLLGTAQYPSPQQLTDSIQAAAVDIITVSLRREAPGKTHNYFWHILQQLDCRVLPNTAGCYSAKEAVTTAQMAREVFHTHWIKLEVIGDQYTLQPDPFELVQAATELVKLGFEVWPYCTDDLLLCQRLIDCGCQILMPWAAPIGSGQGIINPQNLRLLRERFPNNILIVDAGLGKPSHAAQAMELGFDAVLLNTAVAKADDPVLMAQAFAQAVNAGRQAHQAGMMAPRELAQASTPLVDKPFWHNV